MIKSPKISRKLTSTSHQMWISTEIAILTWLFWASMEQVTMCYNFIKSKQIPNFHLRQKLFSPNLFNFILLSILIPVALSILFWLRELLETKLSIFCIIWMKYPPKYAKSFQNFLSMSQLFKFYPFHLQFHQRAF